MAGFVPALRASLPMRDSTQSMTTGESEAAFAAQGPLSVWLRLSLAPSHKAYDPKATLFLIESFQRLPSLESLSHTIRAAYKPYKPDSVLPQSRRRRQPFPVESFAKICAGESWAGR